MSQLAQWSQHPLAVSPSLTALGNWTRAPSQIGQLTSKILGGARTILKGKIPINYCSYGVSYLASGKMAEHSSTKRTVIRAVDRQYPEYRFDALLSSSQRLPEALLRECNALVKQYRHEFGEK